MGDTKIQWTQNADGSQGKTWNPIRARNKVNDERGWYCEHVSEGCRNCYAERMNLNTYFGNGLPYKVGSLDDLDLYLDEKILKQPLGWRKPTNVFVCSMTDLFGRWVPNEWIDRIFGIMGDCSEINSHVFQVLTKRPERMLDYMENRARAAWNAPRMNRSVFPPRNIWLGTSVEDQESADERIPRLLSTPAAVRWISAEPLLGPVDLKNMRSGTFNALDGIDFEDIGDIRDAGDLSKSDMPGLDWVVAGGESGPGARSLDLRWIKSIVEQCNSAKVPIFVKQLGYRPWWDGVSTKAPADHIYLEPCYMDEKAGWRFDLMRDKKGGDPSEWPEDLRVREFPKAA